jgi:hypothetical protein
MEKNKVKEISEVIALNFLINKRTLTEISKFGDKELFHLKEDILTVNLIEEISLPCYIVETDKDKATMINVYKDYATQLIGISIRDNRDKTDHIYRIAKEITDNEYLKFFLK